MPLALPLPESPSSEIKTYGSGGVGFAVAKEKIKENPFNFLIFAITNVDLAGHHQVWHAVIQGQHYGPYNEKAELMDQICFDLSIPCPKWVDDYFKELDKDI